jgi:hypothetical protein
MSEPRLCERKEEMLKVLRVLVKQEGKPLQVGHQISLLRCPAASGHCDHSKPCRALIGAAGATNRMLVSEIEDEFFRRGFYKNNE